MECSSLWWSVEAAVISIPIHYSYHREPPLLQILLTDRQEPDHHLPGSVYTLHNWFRSLLACWMLCEWRYHVSRCYSFLKKPSRLSRRPSRPHHTPPQCSRSMKDWGFLRSLKALGELHPNLTWNKFNLLTTACQSVCCRSNFHTVFRHRMFSWSRHNTWSSDECFNVV